MRRGAVQSVWLAIAGIGVLVCGSQPGAAQSRAGVPFKTLGAISQPGDSAKGPGFYYSYGLGSLQGSYVGMDSGALRSSLTPSSGFGIPRSGGAASAGILANPSTYNPSPSAVQLYSPGSGRLISLQSYWPGMSFIGKDTALGAAQTYLTAVSTKGSQWMRNSDKPITSLVPEGNSLYSQYMEKGESAFRSGDYSTASGYFQLANDISRTDPESLLSLAHTGFAVATYSYALSAHYLRLAIRYFPELPLTRLQPRGFFGDKTKYAGQIMRLEDHLAQFPNDIDACWVLAYFRWFGDDITEARSAIVRAYALSVENQNTEMMEALRAFWDGMVASGKISGELPLATRPARETTVDKGAASQPHSQPANP